MRKTDSGGIPGAESMELRFKAELAQMDRVRAFLEQSLRGLMIAEEEYYQIELAIHEVCINIIRYAYPGNRSGEIRMKISADKRKSEVKIEIRDTGIPFNPSAADPPDLDAKIRRGDRGGYGIFLSRRIMDVFDYRREDGENVLRLSKKI